MKKSRQRTVRVKSTILICAMLLSSILPAALALGAEEPVDNLETGKVETIVVVESGENGDDSKDTNIETVSNSKINSVKDGFSEKVEKVENNTNDGDDSQSSGDGFQSDLPPPSDDIKNTTVKKEDNQKISISNPPDCDCVADCICSTKHKNTGGDNFFTENAKDDEAQQVKSQEAIRKQITQKEYDSFQGKFPSNNDTTVIAAGLRIVSSAHDGWWIHADETVTDGVLEIAYKIADEYFIVTFTIAGAGTHFIGDGRGAEGVNHVKVGPYGEESRGVDSGKDNPENGELKPDPKPEPDSDAKDDSKKKHSSNSKENKKLKQNEGTDPEPKVDSDPKPSPDPDKSNEGTNPEPDAEIDPESAPNTGTGQSSDRGSSSDSNPEAGFEAEPEQAPGSNPKDDSSTNLESEGSSSEDDKTAVPAADEGSKPSDDTPKREARAGSSASPKTGEIANYHHLLAFASAVIAVFSAAGLIRIRIEEI